MQYNLFDSLLEGVLVLDSNKEIIYCNNAAQTLGRSTSNKIRNGTRLGEIIKIDNLESLFNQAPQANGPALYQNHSYGTDGGETVTVQIRVQPLEVQGGDREKWIVYIRGPEASSHSNYQEEIKTKE